MHMVFDSLYNLNMAFGTSGWFAGLKFVRNWKGAPISLSQNEKEEVATRSHYYLSS